MTHGRGAFALSLALLVAAPAAAEERRALTVRDTPPLERVVLGEFTPASNRQTRFAGAATPLLAERIELAAEEVLS